MSKWIEKKTAPVLPIYFVGLVWLVCGLILPLYKLWALLAAAALSAVAYVLGSRLCPKRVELVEQPFLTGSEDADAMLTLIQGHIKTLHTLDEQIPDDALSAAIRRMEQAGQAIMDEVEQRPDKAKIIRRFANHYLPDAVKILTAYARLEQQGVKGDNAAALRAEVEQNAASIAAAFENQLDALYSAEVLDIGADLDVLQSMMKGQGL